MKNVKVLASIAALATVSCIAAVSASAATSVEFKMDAAKSSATTKVVDVNLVSDEYEFVAQGGVDIAFGPSVDPTQITVESQFTGTTFEEFDADANIYTLYAMNSNSNPVSFTNGVVKLATLTIPVADLDLAVDYLDIAVSGGVSLDTDSCEPGSLAVVDAADLGTFTDGEGAPAKAFKAAAEAEGAITWYVTDGTNVASKAVTEVTGGADVVVGLVATGANVANINYATVTID